MILNWNESTVEPVPVQKLLNPGSVAIVGVSSKPGAPGSRVLKYLEKYKFNGEIYIVSRNQKMINGIKCYPSIDDLPKGLDTVVLCVPQTAVLESVQACANRNAASVMIFAAGFAESGEKGRIEQEKIADIGRQNNMVIAGPNFMGLTNFVNPAPLTFAPGLKMEKIDNKPGLSILTQSGGMMSTIRETSQSRGISLTYAISTGNEVIAGIEDYLAYLIRDKHTKVIAMYVEHIKRPQLFLKLAAEARKTNKTIVLLHTGKSEASRAAVQSHTGALAGDHLVISTLLEYEDVIMVDTMEELVDIAWLMTWFDHCPSKGTSIITDSGAFKGYALDFCEDVGLDLPSMSTSTYKSVSNVMPSFAETTNPLDTTAQALVDMKLYSENARAFVQGDEYGSLLIAVLPGSPEIGLAKGRAILQGTELTKKPVIFVVLGEGAPIAEELVNEMKDNRIPLFRSPERALRALARITKYGSTLETVKSRTSSSSKKKTSIFLTKSGNLNEYEGKEILSAAGIPVPQGKLVNEIEEGLLEAERLGYPVVIKAAATDLAHKSDVGGVIVGIKNKSELIVAWNQLHANIKQNSPNIILDGVLIERMAEQGIEMVIGARRDPEWGPIVMVGLGGIWIEVLKDVRFFPPNLEHESIVKEIYSLQSAELLRGARGALPKDVNRLAKTVSIVGDLMESNPEINEIDINPLIVYPEGEGVLALDALIVGAQKVTESRIGV